MEAIAQFQSAPLASFVRESTRFPAGKLTAPLMFAAACAMVATLTSLGIAIYTGWQCGGLFVERIMRIALVSVAVLYVHWLPMGWPALRGHVRFVALTLWTVATSVVLYGQVTFFMLSQQHAGNQRAATVLVATPPSTDPSRGRTLTEIAKDAAKVSADLAHAQTRRCAGDCPTLDARRITLAAQLVALKTEADEAKRREAEEDRHDEQADRNAALRATLRADPVALPVASWLGTTEHRLELIIGLAYAAVLEGAAVMGWALVLVASGRVMGADLIPSNRGSGMPDLDPKVETDLGRTVVSEDDQLLEQIHSAVVAGEIKPTQDSIRKFLRCAQPKAGNLNRQYLARFAATRSHGGDNRANP